MVNSIMGKTFVKVTCDVHCEWTGNYSPKYRAFVDDELFTERSWIWQNVDLEESFQIEAWPGKYTISYKLLEHKNARLWADNYRVEAGPATITADGQLEIQDANS